MLIFRNISPLDISKRNHLLQKALRNSNIDFTIDAEYPMNLSRKDLSKSYGGFFKNNLVTHANLQPRLVIHNKKTIAKIGLIGNVATCPNHQGLGYMRKTLDFIINECQQKKLDAVFLWSDLDSFYTKMGFHKFGSERRYYIKESSPQEKIDGITFEVPRSENLTDKDIKCLLNLRDDKNPTLKRTIPEFKSLLTIPDTYLIIARNNLTHLKGFALIGKGADFQGVVHEWGAESWRVIKGILNYILVRTGLDQVVTISPQNHNFDKELTNLSSRVEDTYMAHGKFLNTTKEKDIENLFVWGLDSI